MNTPIVFGRRRKIDVRDGNYLAIANPSDPGLRQRFWFTSQSLNQGNSPMCVAYAGSQWLDAAPVRNRGFMNLSDLYKQCQQNDEWDGDDYDGTSVRGLFKVFRQMGFVTEYRWAFNAKSIADWIIAHGPMVVGTVWYSNMMNPLKGFLRLGGDVLGGHAYLIKGVNLDSQCPDGSRGAFRIINSWGSNWGDNGCASISIRDMDKLMSMDGEACTAYERIKNP